MRQEARYVPGMRIALRDAEWRIDRVDVPTHGGMLLTCTGQSELVRGRTARFLTELEQNPEILAPENTELVDDTSGGYAATQLRIHALLESTPPADERIHLGHQAAMDLLPYQLDPALQALKQTRPRILIADAVGLGKTLAAGILTTELIRRGRGKRILVLGVKSMLGQLQREFWQRFTLPLTRLDSVGLQRIRNTIPTNHNPFHHIDRAIISIDTLKQSLEYRQYLENCRWDIVIIDEAHNVARRSTRSQRHRLAELLCTRCDAMLMLSATPHDGSAESFASLIDMLDPTAIANQSDYSREDFADRGLVIRRLRRDVASQMQSSLPERVVYQRLIPASLEENYAYTTVREASFKTLKGGGAGQLFRTTLEKALLSSPAACLSTVENRLKRLASRQEEATVQHDIAVLEDIRSAVSQVTPETFAKYHLLIELLSGKGDTGIGWKPKEPMDRIVLFTESVVTLQFLEAHLPGALKLKSGKTNKQWATLHGGLKDVDQMGIVNDFNRKEAPLRLLLCSDVASEGLNLHHCSHRLIHFDIPWSLMVFQQRNGRVDRYGQTMQPEIHYLLSEAEDQAVRGDQRVLEILIEKDRTASMNLGDPSEFQGGSSVAEQEEETATLMEKDKDDLDFTAIFETAASKEDALKAFFDDRTPTTAADVLAVTVSNTGLYRNARTFLEAGLEWLQCEDEVLDWSIRDGLVVIEQAPRDLQQIAQRLPREAIPENWQLHLTDDPERIQADMVQARDAQEGSFGQLHYLWPQHPVLSWLRTRVSDAFGRNVAPVMRLPEQLPADQHWFLAHGGFPNRRGQALIQDHVAVCFSNDSVVDVLPLNDWLLRLKLDGRGVPNRGEARDCTELTLYLPDVVEHLKRYLQALRDTKLAESRENLAKEEARLSALREQHLQQLELELSARQDAESRKQRRRRAREEVIQSHFDEYNRWLTDSVETDDEPYIQILAVITGDPGEALEVGSLQEQDA